MYCLFVNVPDYAFIQHDVVPLGLLSLATVVNSSALHKSNVLEMNYLYHNGILDLSHDLSENIESSAKYILSLSPDFISLYTLCDTHCYGIMLSMRLKELSPSIIIAMGGPHASVTAKENLANYRSIDIIGIGEGEQTIIELLDSYLDDRIPQSSGVAYRDGDKIIIKPQTDLVENLDELPYIDYSLLNFNIYNMERIPIDVGRGCPYCCTFCSTSSFWGRKYRIKSAKRIFSEIISLKEKYNVNYFLFDHDIFPLNKALVFDLCHLISISNLSIWWGCSSRVDSLDENMIKVMSESGCIAMHFGIETGSQKMQNIIKKNLDLTKLTILINLLDKYRIKPQLSFIYGFPGESKDDLLRTLELYERLVFRYQDSLFDNKYNIQINKLMFLPGTEEFLLNKNNLVRNGSVRSGIKRGILSWNNSLVDKLIEDIEIFPQYYTLNSDFNKNIENLDVYYMYFYSYLKDYFNATFTLLLKHYKNHLDLFLAIESSVSNGLLLVFPAMDDTIHNIIDRCLILLEQFINISIFGNNDEAIREIFLFEYYVYLHIHSRLQDVIVKFKYNVILFKRNVDTQLKLENLTIKFSSHDGQNTIAILD